MRPRTAVSSANLVAHVVEEGPEEKAAREAGAGPGGQTREDLASQEARAKPVAWPAARVAPAGQELGRRRQGLLASRGLWNGLLAESELLDGPQAMWDRGSSSPPTTAKLNNANNCK